MKENQKNFFTIYLWTFIIYGLTLAANLFLYYYISHFYNKTEFQYYVISKRIVSVSFYFLMLGLVLSLPKHIARDFYNVATNSNYFMISVILVGITSLIFSFLAFFAGNFLSVLFTGGKLYKNLMFPISLYMISMAFYSVIFSYCRGIMNVLIANFLALTSSITPIFALLFSKTIISFYFHSAMLIFLLNVVVLGYLLAKKSLNLSFKIFNFKIESKKLLSYGLPRIPGDFAIEGLLSIPVFITAHYISTTEASYLGMSVTLMAMYGTCLSPINLILLPFASNRIQNGDYATLKSHITKLLSLVLIIILISIIILYFSSDILISLYLGKSQLIVAKYLRFLLLGVIPYSIYAILRSVIDAGRHRPVNGINAVISLMILIISTFVFLNLGFKSFSALFGLTIGLFALGILSYLSYVKIINKTTHLIK